MQDKRYLNVELILEDQSGLKIPKSSVIKNHVMRIPQDYITTGGNSSDSGVMIQDKDSAVFQQIEIYYVSDDGTNYVNPESLKAGTTLIKPESSETMTVEKTAELSGVYNINQDTRYSMQLRSCVRVMSIILLKKVILTACQIMIISYRMEKT